MSDGAAGAVGPSALALASVPGATPPESAARSGGCAPASDACTARLARSPEHKRRRRLPLYSTGPAASPAKRRGRRPAWRVPHASSTLRAAPPIYAPRVQGFCPQCVALVWSSRIRRPGGTIHLGERRLGVVGGGFVAELFETAGLRAAEESHDELAAERLHDEGHHLGSPLSGGGDCWCSTHSLTASSGRKSSSNRKIILFSKPIGSRGSPPISTRQLGAKAMRCAARTPVRNRHHDPAPAILARRSQRSSAARSRRHTESPSPAS